MKILIVDDDELSQRILSILLSNMGHASVFASNGIEALQIIKTGSADLVFLDLHLPQMDGIEVCKRVRAWETGEAHTPIIALTASVEDISVKEYAQAGIDDYISKPYKERQISMVLEACQSGLYRKPKISAQENTTHSATAARTAILAVKNALPLFGGDVSEYRTLLKEFLTSTPERLSRMRENVSKKQWKDLAIQAHNLKGVSAYFGAAQLSALAARLEQLCNDGQTGLAEQTLGDIAQNLEKVRARANQVRQHGNEGVTRRKE